jgi:energy-coupling factor transporter transmembrane protein EcfT
MPTPPTPTPTTPTPTTAAPPTYTKILSGNVNGTIFEVTFNGAYWNIAVHANRTAVEIAVVKALALALGIDFNLIYLFSMRVSSLVVKFGTESQLSPATVSDLEAAFLNHPEALNDLQLLYTQLTGSTEQIGVTFALPAPTASTTHPMCGLGCMIAIVIGITVTAAIAISAAVYLFVVRTRAAEKAWGVEEVPSPDEKGKAPISDEKPEHLPF